MNLITELLDLEDEDIIVEDIKVEGARKYITSKTNPSIHFCPQCNFRIHSKGTKPRKINHPVLQEPYECIIILNQRRWKCTNKGCGFECNEAFNFVKKRKRNTNATDMLIINAFRDLSVSAVSIANKFNVSDTYAIETFEKYVKLNRLPLPDMYNPYIRFADKYFPNAVPVVDSFHVVQWITNSIDKYIRSLLKKYRQRDRELFERKWGPAEMPATIPPSKEVYLLQKYRWLILSNQDNITYYYEPRLDKHLHCLMNTYDYEDELFRMDPMLRDLRDYKEMYVRFNARNAGQPMDARIELDELIGIYLHSGNEIFRDFAHLLIKHHDYIINSFVMVERHGQGKVYSSRLSNGPIESLNRKVKDLKRLGRGYRNFEHFRTRFLFATRYNPVIDGSSDSTPVTYYEED